MTSSDGEFSDLLASAKTGDERARTQLIRTYIPGVLAQVRRGLSPALRRRYDSVDVVQSVATALLGALSAFEDRGATALRGCIRRAAENKLRDKGRRMRRNGQLRELPNPPDAAGDEIWNPSEAIARRDEQQKMSAMLGKLSPQSRQVLRQRLREGLTFGEIADQIQAPSANAVRMRFARAVSELRQKWEQPRRVP